MRIATWNVNSVNARLETVLKWFEEAKPDVACLQEIKCVDEMSLVMLKGSVIDYVDELAGAEFRIRNPNAKTSCGCGVSFSI